ncbi:ATP-binding protein [Ramlibacter albus]|uniref:Tetratricopeptide repeat protein n=1 Tax=Ramlibacter albus TaxID=2079448 RepID=A0A923S1K5_9BURK|nr:tetratricopeptide repeat protein [Ramlibacter albus]MBC5764376.1 tetratricopeptide repeat protein [Ramlibacter albus]
MAIYLHLFGRPRVDVDGAAADLPLERRHQLLAWLALKRGWVARSEAATLLWPDQPARLANANLRKTLFRLQSQPWAAAVDAQAHALNFTGGSDVADFEQALRDKRLADAARFEAHRFLEGYDEGGGDAWPAWLAFERARLTSAWRDAALELLASEMDAADALDLSARMLAADPSDEDALRAHMGWLASGGQVAAARRAFRDFDDRLRQEFGVAASAELRALHDSLGTPRVPEAAPARAPEDGFVGRSAELQAVTAAFAPGAGRLASLVGPGGAGKTRLARRVIAELAGNFEHGAAFVSLEEVTHPADVPVALVRQLDMGTAGAEPAEQLKAWLAERRMLLVLDNFEHLAPAAPLVGELLAAAPGLHVLVTSRMRLGLPGEALVAVHGLPCPDPEDRDRLESFDAVRLFVSAARRVDPAFVPNEVGSIIEICRHVDGLPLALELAAAWTRVLSCEAIAAELRGGTELLRASDAAHPARHASLDLVFEQSWAMLVTAEREALAALTVFRGGFAADAARGVAGVSLPVLAALVDKSLLRKDGRRLVMHPVVHQLAAQKLEPARRDTVEAAHAAFYCELVAQLRKPTELAEREALAALDADYENWTTAWYRAAHSAQLMLLVRATPTLRAYSDHRGSTREVCSLFEDALGANPAPAEPRFEPIVLGGLAHCLQRLDRFAESIAAAHRALQASRNVADPEARLRCLNTLGACSMRLAKMGEARRYYQMALKLAPSVPNPRYAAVLMQNLAQIEKRQDHAAEALRLLLGALERFREIGDHASQALCLYQLGSMQCDLGDLSAGVQSLRSALALCDSHGLNRTRGYVLTGLADAAIEMGDLDAARDYATQGLELARASGARLLESWMLLHHARLAVRGQDIAAARDELRTAVELTLQVGSPVAQVAAVICFGEVLAAQGVKDCAARVLELARGQGSASQQDRKQIDAIRTRWALPAPGPVPAMTLAELGHRIVGETPLAHAPLIADLRAQR